jgi:hypothetical protein
MYSFAEPWREFWPHVLMGAKFTPHWPFLPSVAWVKTGLLRASVPPAERVVNLLFLLMDDKGVLGNHKMQGVRQRNGCPSKRKGTIT